MIKLEIIITALQFLISYNIFLILSILLKKNMIKLILSLLNIRRRTMKFNKDTRIGELLEQAPEKAEVLLDMGMHCLGCPASQMETLEEACDVHGIDVEEVLEKLNK